MATNNSNYVTRTDLSNYSKQVLALLSLRDTNIETNANDILALQQAIEGLDTGLHYCGEVSILPPAPDNGALCWFDNVTIKVGEPKVTGYYFYVASTTSWKCLSNGDLEPEEAPIDFTKDPWE